MRRSLRRILFGIGVVVFVFGVFRVTVYVRAQNGLPTLAGEPTTEEDLKVWYPETVSEAENAAPLYLKAARAFTSPEYGDKIIPFFNGNELSGPGNALPDETLQSITDFLAKNAETVLLLHEAAALPKCRYPAEGQKEGELSVNRPWPILALEAVLHAERGDNNGAVDALLTGFAAAGSLRNEPMVINTIQRWWCSRFLLLALERVLTRVTLTDEQLMAIAAALANADTAEGMTRGLVGMRCGAAPYFRGSMEIKKEMYEPNLPPQWLEGWLRQVYFLSGLADMERRRFNELIHDWQEARKRVPFSARKDAAATLQDRLNKASNWQAPITRAFIRETSITGLVIQETCYKARVATAELALAMERFRLKYGRLPDKPEELIPEFLEALPADPLNDQPLSYRRDAQGYSVSSVGADVPHAQWDRSWDTREEIVFSVGR